MTHLRPYALLAALLAAGCSTTPAPSAVTAPAAKPVRPLPDNSLSSPLLYDLLSAEVAAQRGDFGFAATNYLRAAWDTRDPRVAKRATRLALAARQQAQALEATELWVELEPEDLEGRQILAALLIRSGRADDALPHLEALLDASGDDTSEGFQTIVTLLSRESDKALALTLFDKLAQKRAADPNAQFAHAQLSFLLGKVDVARAKLDTLLAQKPRWSKALVLKATIERHQGNLEAALASLKAAVAVAPEDAGLRLSFARMLVDAQRFDAARDEFEALQRQMPDNMDITYALGLLSLQLGNLDAAAAEFRRLLEAGHRTDEAAYALGQIAENRQKPDEALRWYDAVAEGGNFLEAKLRAAGILMRRDGLDAARAYLQRLRAEAPEEQARLSLAEADLLRGAEKFPEAMAVLDAALTGAPDDFDLLYARAMVAERLDRLDLLERDLRRILAADPDNAQALNALGYTLADRTARHQEALELIQKALAQKPDDPAINDSMGWALFRLGRYPEAEQYLKKAAATMDDAEVAAHLGELYWATGRKDEARQVWDQGLQHSPDDPIINTVIKRLTQ